MAIIFPLPNFFFGSAAPAGGKKSFGAEFVDGAGAAEPVFETVMKSGRGESVEP